MSDLFFFVLLPEVSIPCAFMRAIATLKKEGDGDLSSTCEGQDTYVLDPRMCMKDVLALFENQDNNNNNDVLSASKRRDSSNSKK